MSDGGKQVLEIGGARHRYGGVTALDGVDLTVRASECVALLGPNGAGKTTLVGLATGLLPAQEGGVRVCGQGPRRAAPPGGVGAPRPGAARGGGAAARVLTEVGTAALPRRRAGKLSGGQQQRV